jgi:hypothetical protein
LLTPALLPLVTMLLLSAICSTTRAISQAPRSVPAFHEVTAALGFIAIPIVAVILAKLVTGAFVFRYVLPAVIGFSILFAFAAYGLFDGRAIMSAVLVLSLCGTLMVLQVRNFRYLDQANLRQAKTYEFLRSDSESKLPIVASDLSTFMTLAYYAPNDIASRVVYLADPQAEFRYFGHNSVDQGILDLKPWFRLKVEEYAPYVASQERFLVYGGVHIGNWLLFDQLANRRIELRSRNGNNLLFLVSHKE